MLENHLTISIQDKDTGELHRVRVWQAFTVTSPQGADASINDTTIHKLAKGSPSKAELLEE
jgi:uncharacterized membrane-anchored protein